MTENNKPEKFPAVHCKPMTFVVIPLPGLMGDDEARDYLRSIAEEHLPALYHMAIDTGVCGKDCQGNQISIDSLGKWFFGAPGYTGHVRISGRKDNAIKVEFAEDCLESVRKFVKNLTKVAKTITQT